MKILYILIFCAVLFCVPSSLCQNGKSRRYSATSDSDFSEKDDDSLSLHPRITRSKIDLDRLRDKRILPKKNLELRDFLQISEFCFCFF